MDIENPAEQLILHPHFRWCEGMRDQHGRRVVDVDAVDGASTPDLTDMPTAGALLQLLDEQGRLTDVVREGDDWIVAVEIHGDVQGYASHALGEAAAWAMLALLDAEEDASDPSEPVDPN